MKICIKCEKELPSTDFYKKRETLEKQCKKCKDIQRKARILLDHTYNERTKASREKYLKQNPEVVIKRKESSAQLYQRNKDAHRAWVKAWNKKNPEKRTAYYRKWQQANKDIVRMHSNKRRAKKLSAIPNWVDTEFEQFAIAEAYNLATLRQGITGVVWHVDHLVPLQSEFVCGFHCSANLAVIPASLNLSKGNRYWPDMWEELGEINGN